MDLHPWISFGGLTALYFATVLAQSALKPMWFDEFITLYISQLGSVRAIWSVALVRGADPNPPLYHVLAMYSMRVFGQNALALRLPAILANWVAMAGLYVFLRARLPVFYTVLGTCFFIAMGGFDYSYEARPYALLLCFSISSLLLWRGVSERRNSNVYTIGLALALAGGISSNYFGCLAVLPIAAGETLLSFQRKDVHWRV